MVDAKPRSFGVNQGNLTGDSNWDDVMLAMDVVDTLRHRKLALDDILAKDDEALIDKIRGIYRDQGIDVSDHTIRDAVDALKEERFSYKPPTKGWRLRLAYAYIDRAKWGKRIALVSVIGALVVAANYAFESYKERKRQTEIEARKASEREFAELAAESGILIQRARDLAETPDAKNAVESVAGSLTFAIEQRDHTAAKHTTSELRNLTRDIGAAFDIRIVSRSGEKSGVFRVPEDNPRARNYYIIVEAIDRSGNPVQISITSEEDGSTQRVSTWGIRVVSSVFERVKQDKLDDGIIQNVRFGSKRSGALNPDYLFPVEGGSILRW